MIRTELARYALVGLVLNAVFYAAYLLLASLLRDAEVAMTLTFSIGILCSFLANRKLTFGHRGDRLRALWRFLVCYGILYLINFVALWFFVRRMGVPHQIVQGCAILVLPLLGFSMQKYWVFFEATASIESRPAIVDRS